MDPDALACHSCDVRLCNNPSHIFEGTYKDNTQDMMTKGRNKAHPNPPKGSSNPASKLNDEAVGNILRDKRSYGDIAKDHGVSGAVVASIKTGKTWKHVPGERTAVVGEEKTLALRRAKTAKLTECDVRGIRSDTRPYPKIASDYGISISSVCNVKNRKIWKDVD
jgi:uncharacterized protein YerC